MQEKNEFRKALQNIMQIAAAKGNYISKEEVENSLSLFELPDEQKEMVYQYLEAQKIQVEGAVNTGENPFAKEAAPEADLTEEDKAFLEEYLETAEAGFIGEGMDPRYPEYMKVCADIALSYAGKGIPLADLIQEGNLGLLMALGSLELKDDGITEDEYIREGIRETILAFIEEETELKDSDDKMLEKINYIAEAIHNLSEELERKVSLEELSAYLEMPEEEVAEILKLTGEEIEPKKQEEEENVAGAGDAVGYADVSDFKVF